MHQCLRLKFLITWIFTADVDAKCTKARTATSATLHLTAAVRIKGLLFADGMATAYRMWETQKKFVFISEASFQRFKITPRRFCYDDS